MWLLDCILREHIAESGMTEQEWELKRIEAEDARRGISGKELDDFLS